MSAKKSNKMAKGIMVAVIALALVGGIATGIAMFVKKNAKKEENGGSGGDDTPVEGKSTTVTIRGEFGYINANPTTGAIKATGATEDGSAYWVMTESTAHPGYYTIRSASYGTNAYLTANTDNDFVTLEQATSIENKHLWLITEGSNGSSIKSKGRGKFISGASNGDVVCTVGTAQGWEMFNISTIA